MPFTGHHEHVIDEKNRLAIPASIRSELDPVRDGKRFYVVPSGQPGPLLLYTESYFQRLSDRFENDLVRDENQLLLEQTLFPLAQVLDMDSAGRVSLPAEHLRIAGLGRDVTVAGCRDHIEIVDRAEFNRRKEETLRNFPEIQRKVREAQLRMKKHTGPGAGE